MPPRLDPSTWIAVLASLALVVAPLQAQTPQESQDPAAQRRAAVEANNRGVEALEAGRLEEALLELEQARGLDGESDAIARNLAEALRRRGDAAAAKRGWDAAREDYRRADSLQPNKSTFALLEALIPFERQRWEQAVESLGLVLERFPAETEAWLALGACKLHLFDLSGAVEAWKSGAEVDPEHERLKAMLERYELEAKLEKELYTDLTQNFAYHYHLHQRDVASSAPTLASDLEEAFLDCQTFYLGHLPKKRVQVLLYNEEDFRRVTRVDGWVGGLFDGRIRIPVNHYAAERERLKKTIRHELGHAFLHDLAGGSVPTWLDEGMAQLLEGRDPRPARVRLTAGGWPEVKNLRGSFLGLDSTAKVKQAYDAGLALAAELDQNFGRGVLMDFLSLISSARELEKDLDPEDALVQIYGLSLEQLIEQAKRRSAREKGTIPRRR